MSLTALDAKSLNRKQRRAMRGKEQADNDETLSIAKNKANHLLSLADQALNDNDDDMALEYLERALVVDPYNTTARVNLSCHYLNKERLDKAKEIAEEGLKYDDSALLHYNLGVIHMKRRDLEKSLASLNKAIVLKSGFSLAHNAVGNIMLMLGEFERAILSFQKALDLDPSLLTARLNLAIALMQLAKYEMAVVNFDEVIKKDPKAMHAYIYFSMCLNKMGFYKESRDIQKLAFKLICRPEVFLQAIQGAPIILDSLDQLVEWRQDLDQQTREILANPVIVENNEPKDAFEASFYTPYLGGNPRELLHNIARVIRTCYPKLSFVAKHCLPPEKGGTVFPLIKPDSPRKIKIGFISAKCFEHAVTWAFRNLILAAADQEDMEVILYNVILKHEYRPSYKHPNLRVRTIRWAIYSDTPTQEVFPYIEEDGLDILVYLDIGMDQMTYYLAFGRLAPVQVLLPGHPVTSGIDTIDYFISSETMESTVSDTYFTEKLIRFKSHNTTYSRPDLNEHGGIVRRSDYKRLPQEGILYFCVQSIFKINPIMDACFKEILEAVPGSHIVMFVGMVKGCTDLLQKRLKRNLGDVYDRIVWLKRCDVPSFLRILNVADVMLDTFPFNGGNTTFQTIAAGKPLVGIKGDYIVSRATYGICSRLGITDLITDSPEAYTAMAIKLGLDDVFRKEMSEKITSVSDDLFDEEEPKREWVDFLRSAVKGPDHVAKWIGNTPETESPAQWALDMDAMLHKKG